MADDGKTKEQLLEDLRQSEELYRTLIEALPDAVAMSDLEGRITFASQQTVDFYGCASVDELLGRNPLEFIAPEDHAKLLNDIQQTLKDGISRKVEYTFIRNDGTRFLGEVSGVLIKDASGNLVALMALMRDISDRKRAEDALQRERRTLEHLLRSSDHERQLIAYEIHDGLAQQLAAAIMQLETYAHQKGTVPQEAVKAYEAAMTMLHQAHFEARRLISGVRPPILDESGVIAAVALLVNEQTLLHAPQIEFLSKVKFNRLAPNLENAIYRIVQEGLANACRHSQSKQIRVELSQQGDRLRIKIRDWGVGFAPENVEENRFGLEGIRERTRLIGGVTTVESAPGQGTCITIELPLLARE